jgi:hypothetical protein
LLALCCCGSKGEAQARNPAGVSVGAALWAEIGGSDCADVNDSPSCASGLNHVFPGGIAAFDLDLLHWLRLGLSAGLGYYESVGAVSSDGGHTAGNHWFVPLVVHTYWRVELGKHITLWGGPELGLGVFVDSRRTYSPGMETETQRSNRSAFVAGVAVGLDVRLLGALRAGIELGEAVLLKPRVESSSEEGNLDLRAMTRMALVLRYL